MRCDARGRPTSADAAPSSIVHGEAGGVALAPGPAPHSLLHLEHLFRRLVLLRLERACALPASHRAACEKRRARAPRIDSKKATAAQESAARGAAHSCPQAAALRRLVRCRLRTCRLQLARLVTRAAGMLRRCVAFHATRPSMRCRRCAARQQCKQAGFGRRQRSALRPGALRRRSRLRSGGSTRCSANVDDCRRRAQPRTGVTDRSR